MGELSPSVEKWPPTCWFCDSTIPVHCSIPLFQSSDCRLPSQPWHITTGMLQVWYSSHPVLLLNLSLLKSSGVVLSRLARETNGVGQIWPNTESARSMTEDAWMLCRSLPVSVSNFHFRFLFPFGGSVQDRHTWLTVRTSLFNSSLPHHLTTALLDRSTPPLHWLHSESQTSYYSTSLLDSDFTSNIMALSRLLPNFRTSRKLTTELATSYWLSTATASVYQNTPLLDYLTGLHISHYWTDYLIVLTIQLTYRIASLLNYLTSLLATSLPDCLTISSKTNFSDSTTSSG